MGSNYLYSTTLYFRSQIVPGKQHLPFSIILQTLFVIGRLHLRGIHVHHGPAPDKFFNSIQSGKIVVCVHNSLYVKWLTMHVQGDDLPYEPRHAKMALSVCKIYVFLNAL